jgi:hypothetical protein
MKRRLGQMGIFVEVGGRYYLSEERLGEFEQRRQGGCSIRRGVNSQKKHVRCPDHQDDPRNPHSISSASLLSLREQHTFVDRDRHSNRRLDLHLSVADLLFCKCKKAGHSWGSSNY